LIHFLTLDFDPRPQEREQTDQLDQSANPPFIAEKGEINQTILYRLPEISATLHSDVRATGYLRHGLASHGELSTKSPSHIFPPFIGAGLLQYRVRSWTPKPQLTEHGSQACQSDHRPSTKTR
jgi:hypothetical protein